MAPPEKTNRLRIENDFYYIFLSTLTVNFILFFWTFIRGTFLQKERKNVSGSPPRLNSGARI
ncbi:hypothetical protein EHQ76_08110 [Leptospira barantonii]|uniref:Uncharacterized protein n=1 Tax=Leptospira barantonii TaxID=2023184 RepID=A0A5F2BDF7_9LEPT|nr:hypothetical protein EHQ76_08110 [Leptospira barantonii]